MDINALFAALTAAQQGVEESDPFKPMADMGDQLGELVIKQSAQPGGNLKDSILAGLATGLIGGFSKNLGSSYKADQNALINQVMPNVMAGQLFQAPEDMAPSVLSSLNNARSVFALDSALNARDNQNAMTSALIKGAIDNPYQAEAQQAAVAALSEPQKPKTPTAETAPMVAPAPNSFQSYLKQFQGDEELARAAVKRDIEQPDRAFTQGNSLEGQLQDLRKEFQGLPEVKAYVTSDIGYKSLQKAIQDPSAASDLELIRGAIQAIEPGMAVREGEQLAVEKSASIPDMWKGAIKKSLSGESALSPELRQGILRIAERRYQEYADKFNTANQFYQNQATRRGLPDPKGVTYLDQAAPVDLKALALQFPNTPEGMTAFKAAAEKLKNGR